MHQEQVCSAISSLIYSRLKIPHQLSGGYGSRLTPRSQGDGNAIYRYGLRFGTCESIL